MLKIRKEQMSVLEGVAQADFHRRLLIYLRQEMLEAITAFDDFALLARISESERRASTYGIRTDGGVAQFVCLTFAAGPTFDEIPEVNEYLKELGVDPEERLDELIDYLAALEDEESSE